MKFLLTFISASAGRLTMNNLPLIASDDDSPDEEMSKPMNLPFAAVNRSRAATSKKTYCSVF